MNKKIFGKYQINELVLIGISSFLLLLIYNFQTVKNRFNLYFLDKNSSSTILENTVFLSELFIAFSTIFLFFIILSFNKKLLKTGLIIIFFLSSLSFYILSKFGIIFDEVMLANALTSIGHFDEVIDYSLIFYFLFGAFLPAFLIFQTKISPVKTSTKFVFSFIICNLYLCCYLSLAPNAINKIFTIYSPINYVGSFYKYGERFCGSSEKKKSRVDLDKFYNFDYQPKFKDLNVVVIIGESLRADHLHFNGYLRNTTPNLENIKNLLHYKAKASFNTTTPSVTSLLSHRTKAEFVDIPPEKSIISVFKNLGFKTYWYSAQSSKEFGNGMLNIMASEADDYFFIDKLQTSLKANDKVYDGSLLPFLQNALASGGNKFIILHSFGSHIRYSERSPAEFKKFQPECTSAPYVCKRVLAMNAYDNSVLYTDHFISSVIKSLENTNSILFYVSDHGVFFGENNVYANGNSDQIDNVAHIVPMFLYMTDSVLKNKDYRKKFETAKSKTNATNLSHDNFFDSIIDCSGIKSIILKRDLSLCNH